MLPRTALFGLCCHVCLGCMPATNGGSPASLSKTIYDIDFEGYYEGGSYTSSSVLVMEYDPQTDQFTRFFLDGNTLAWEPAYALQSDGNGGYSHTYEDCSTQCETFNIFLKDVVFDSETDVISGFAGAGWGDAPGGTGPFVAGTPSNPADVSARIGKATFEGEISMLVSRAFAFVPGKGDVAITLDFGSLGSANCSGCTGHVYFPSGQFGSAQSGEVNAKIEQFIVGSDGLSARIIIDPAEIGLDSLPDVPLSAGYFGDAVNTIAGTFAAVGLETSTPSWSTSAETFDSPVFGYMIANEK